MMVTAYGDDERRRLAGEHAPGVPAVSVLVRAVFPLEGNSAEAT
jgi:hypothetical protein